MTIKPLALVLGIDSPIGLTVVRELGLHGVPVHGIGRQPKALGAASRYCTTASVRPAGEAIALWLPRLIATTGAGALLAVSEDDLVELAALPDRIGDCAILTPRAAPLSIVLDKARTLAQAAAIGILVPKSWQPMAGESFAARAASLTYPVVVKWPDPVRIIPALTQYGLTLEKVEFITDVGALLALLDRYAPLGQWPLIQQYCPGYGIGQMFHIDRGVVTLRFQHRRLHEWPPEGGSSTLCRSEPPEAHAEQMALSEALLKAIGWEGPAMVEYRYDPATGRFVLMEINGRFWGSMPLATQANAHFAWESYRRGVLDDRSPPPPYRVGLRARFMIPETRRLIRVLFQPKQIADPAYKRRPLRDLADYFLGFLEPRMRYFVFAWRDPAPFFSDMLAIIEKFGH